MRKGKQRGVCHRAPHSPNSVPDYTDMKTQTYLLADVWISSSSRHRLSAYRPFL